MAFLKQANAMVVHPRASGRGWSHTRRVATEGITTQDFTSQAREILGGALDPDQYLFTHCTIVASVDTEAPPDVRLGKIKVGSQTVDRRYADYHITPQSSAYVNNNGDSWSRNVLLASYRTFIGAQNFQEHVQLEEKSKGRIIDAVARDIGESVYVDILVATNRKHVSLVRDIESGKMGTLSMGCTTDFTLCSKCGHFAVDETELCDHVRHEKLNTFLDDSNQKRVVAELCGHVDYTESEDAPGGVRFIEASWVGVPAFPGAVMRNIMAAPDGTGKSDSELRALLGAPPQYWSDTAMAKAASFHAKAFEFGEEDAAEEDAPAEEAPTAPFQDMEDQLYKMIKTKVQKRLEQEMKDKQEEAALPASDAPNDSLIKEGFLAPSTSPREVVLREDSPEQFLVSLHKKASQERYQDALKTLTRVASSDVALVEGIATTNAAYGLKVDRAVYRAALQAGPLHTHASPNAFLQSARKASGREFTSAEIRVVVRVGTLLSRRESFNNPKTRN